MNRVWGSWGSVLLLVFLLAFLVSPVCASAQTPEVTILPLQTVVSVDSSMLIKVDPKTSEKPIRITWSIYNAGEEGLGSFPLVDGKGICYFSNEDGNATCGPSPFKQKGETELYVYVITPTEITNKTVPMKISDLKISTNGVQRSDNTVYMYFYMEKKDLMKYTIYKEDMSIYQSNRPLDYDAVDGRYEGNITLNPDVYYFAFVATENTTEGTALRRIEIPSGDFLMIQTNKYEYWTGEKIRITGTTNVDTVKGEIDFPNGTKALDFSNKTRGDNTFSYEFASSSNWPEGEYGIKTSQPLVKSLNFSIVEFFEIMPESVSGVVNKSEDFTGSVQLKNLRNETNISFATTGGMKNEYVEIGDTRLSQQEATAISIEIPNVESDIQGAIRIKTPEGLELDIPVSVKVREEEAVECPSVTKLSVDKDHLVWSQEWVVDEEIPYSVLLSNSGESALSDFEYIVEDTLGGEQSLESLEGQGLVDIPLEDFSIEPGESEYLDIKITPASAGKYQGLITFRSGGNSAFIFVDLNCFEDISGGLESLEESLEDMNINKDTLDDINSDIGYARDLFSSGKYSEASGYYESASAKVEAIKSGGVTQPMDFTWVIIIIVVVIVVLLAIWYFKSKKPAISQYEEETKDLEGFE